MGKFVSDRHHHLREMALQQYRYANEAQVKAALAIPAANFQSSPSTISHQQLNNKVWLEFIGCIQSQNFNYERQVDDFINSFIDEQYKKMSTCLLSLKHLINTYITG